MFNVSVPKNDIRTRWMRSLMKFGQSSTTSSISGCKSTGDDSPETIDLCVQTKKVYPNDSSSQNITIDIQAVSARSDGVLDVSSSTFPSSTWVQFTVLFRRTFLTIMRNMVSCLDANIQYSVSRILASLFYLFGELI